MRRTGFIEFCLVLALVVISGVDGGSGNDPCQTSKNQFKHQCLENGHRCGAGVGEKSCEEAEADLEKDCGYVCACDAIVGHVPSKLHVERLRVLTHSVNVSVNVTDVKPGVNIMYIWAKEIIDITGNIPDKGYAFGYNAEFPHFVYPELDSGKQFTFQVQYGYKLGSCRSSASKESDTIVSLRSRIQFRKIPRSFKDALTECLSEGKTLAAIHSKIRNDYIREQMVEENLDYEGAWIGLRYNSNNAHLWNWEDGTHLGYKNFVYMGEKGKEIYNPGAENAIAIATDGKWQYHNPIDKLPFFCECTKHEHLDKREVLDSLRGGQ